MQNSRDYQHDQPSNNVIINLNRLQIVNNQLSPNMAQTNVDSATTSTDEFISQFHYQQSTAQQMVGSIPGITTCEDNIVQFDTQQFPLIVENIDFSQGQQTCNTNFGYDVDQTRQSGVIPILEITRQPSSRPHRFRYRSEMHGTHGCLTAEDSTSKKKTYPTVVLKNLDSNAKQVHIVCSLYQVTDHNGMKVPHSHKLIIKRDNQDEVSDPHTKAPTKTQSGLEAIFTDMGIIHTKREDIKIELKEKMIREKLWQMQKTALSDEELGEIEKKAIEYSKDMNLNQVCLCFEAFAWNGTQWLRVSQPVFSNTINNMKSSQVGELKICRMSKCQSPATGGEEIFLFVEKVSRENIKVLLSERGKCGKEDWVQWEAEGIFNSNSDVHRQYGIVFKTPPFKDPDIRSAVDVKIQLLRPTDAAVSEPLTFRYIPVLKRKIEDVENIIPETVLNHEKRCRMNFDSRAGTSSASSESDCFENPGSAYSNSLAEGSDLSSDLVNYHCTTKVVESWDIFDRKDLCLFEAAFNEVYDAFGIEYDASATENTALTNIKDVIGMLSKDKGNNFLVIRESLKNYLNFQLYNGINILLDCIADGSIAEIQDIVSILRRHKLNFMFNSVNREGKNCLHLLAMKGDRILLDLFTKIKVNVNATDNDGNTPLHCAVMGGSDCIVESLLQNCEQVKLDEINNDGCTPLHLAAGRNKPSIMRILIEAGADPRIQNLLTGNNILHILAESEKEHGEVLKLVIKNHVDLIYEQNFDSIDFVTSCIRNDRKRYIKVLESNGINVEETIEDDSEHSIDSVVLSSFNNESIKRTNNISMTILGSAYPTLCNIFDRDGKWKSLCKLMNLEDKVEQWENAPDSPTGNVFDYVLNNGKALSEIVLICQAIGEFDAVDAIDRAIMDQITNPN